MAMELLLLPSSTGTPPNPKRRTFLSSSSSSSPVVCCRSHLCCATRREAFLKTAAFSALSVVFTLGSSFAPATLAETHEAPPSSPALDDVASPPAPPPPRKPLLPGIASTKSWFLHIGDGFSIRVPPTFEDVTEPEDYNAGLSLYGDKVKPKMFAAQFASPDRSEVVSVVVRPSNQLKITFLEAKDITDLGTLKEASKILFPVTIQIIFFVYLADIPSGAKLYSARAIKIKEDEGLRSYYFYEFGVNDQHLALVAAINSGKAVIAGAAAPHSRWEEDGVKLRSAAISLSVS
ncbi:unnamed protein product [Spirodela intermedia]|uniref:PsbP C-terminal domain-containing protein n=1 Tax=Spirodela intermedia TaxID=51605 RepID=A0A7I8JGQ7_SPIIN|nr:unnamed protein product [Spirodela intermedia]CAA6668945.1 unnamed protein product [Spirodela intermedia]